MGTDGTDTQHIADTAKAHLIIAAMNSAPAGT
jgi:hypothetical protein